MSVVQPSAYNTAAQAMNQGEQEVTLMLRGIACRLMDEGVKAILDQVGLRGKFSLVYVPCVVANKSNLGYAFVRFRTWAYAEECFRLCDGNPFGLAAQGKLCRVTLANIQADMTSVLGNRRRKRAGKAPEPLFCNDPIEPSLAASPAWPHGARAPRCGDFVGCAPGAAWQPPCRAASGAWTLGANLYGAGPPGLSLPERSTAAPSSSSSSASPSSSRKAFCGSYFEAQPRNGFVAKVITCDLFEDEANKASPASNLFEDAVVF